MNKRRWRTLRVPEDAAEGGVLLVPVRPEPWYCLRDTCGRIPNASEDGSCRWCGRPREECEK